MKEKFSREMGMEVAEQIRERLAKACERIEIAGSLRRGKQEVGDVEIVYVPKAWGGGVAIVDLFGEKGREAPTSLIEIEIARLENDGTLERRKNVKGRECFGDRIKLMRHTETNVPVDLFSIEEKSWWNYLVCRTGGAESNKRIARIAKARGYKWEPYSPGFVDLSDGRTFPMHSEQDVFKFVDLPYEEPEARP